MTAMGWGGEEEGGASRAHSPSLRDNRPLRNDSTVLPERQYRW